MLLYAAGFFFLSAIMMVTNGGNMIKPHPIWSFIGADESGKIYSLKYDNTGNIGSVWNIRKTQIDTVGRELYCFYDGGKKIGRRVHRLVWECFNGVLDTEQEIDHIDRNPTNNNLSNLRVVTSRENKMNTGKKLMNGKSYSKFKGVSFDKRRNKYTSSIQNGKDRYYLGYYCNEIDAAKAYDMKATELGHLTNKDLGLY